MAYVHVVQNLNGTLPKRAATVERRKLTLATMARRRGLNPRRQPVLCARNGKWIKQSQWRRVTAKRDDVVTFVVMPRGSSLRIAAMLAVLVLATVVAGPIAGALIPGAVAGSTTLAVGTALIGAGLVLGGNYLVNALLPAGASTAAPDALGSPTYAQTLSQQNNTARLNGAIPVLYGRMRFIPDLAAPGWSEWVNKVQRFHQTLILTQGSMQVEKIELGQTNITSYTGVDFEIVEPGDSVTLFEPEVYTSQQVSGSILYAPNDPDGGAVTTQMWSTTGSYLTGDVVYILNTGNGERHFYQANTNTTNFPPSADWDDLGTTDPFDVPYMGPFPVCPPGRTTVQIGIDLALPQGLYALNTETNELDSLTLQWRIDCREIDDNGDPVGGWATLDSEVATSFGTTLVVPAFVNSSFLGGGFSNAADRNSPLTFSFRIQMPYEARWEVRAIRVTDKRQSGQVGHDLTWIGLKSFLGSYSYGDVTALAVRIHSTSAANNSSSHQIAVTGTRNLPFWNEGWFPPVATRSICWAICDMIRNETYGARRDDTAFDLAGIRHLEEIWFPRGDTFDFYAAQRTTLWNAITTAARAGRAVPYHQSGIVRFHRDQEQTIPVQLFSSENIIKDSFVIKFSMPSPEDDVDGIEVKYLDEETWLQASILLPKDGVDESISPSAITLDGVVQAAQANREAEYMLAADRYRRVFIEFDTEMEGLIASRGDLILVHHDVPRWGQSNRLVQIVGARTITLWGRLIDYDQDLTYFVQLRDSRGRPSQPVQVLSYDGDHTLIITTDALYYDSSMFDYTQASEAEPLHMVIGTIDTIPRLAIFLGATPRGGKRVSVQAVLEDDNVHVN